MKSIPAIIFILLTAFYCTGCSKDDPENQKPEDIDDVTISEDITPYGGYLQATDDSGNIITVTFPPGAIRDTTTVTLTILGTYKDLPINERQARAFKIQPSDLSLYKPVVISVEYNIAISDIEGAALFRLRTDEFLAPLSDHSYPDGNLEINASTLILGEFAEGKMTVEEINAQLDLLVSSMGISMKSTGISKTTASNQSSGCEEYKALWDDWADTAGAFLKFFQMRSLLGYYDNLKPGQRTLEEDVDLVCSNIFEQGVKSVLDLGEPNDPCCSDYAHAIESMNQAMTWCGSQSTASDQLNDRYNDVHSQCHTYLDITTEVSIESGGLLIMTTGEVILTLTGTGDGEASVTGTGELAVSGSGDAGGQCQATIMGQTFVTVSGTRDAAYVYNLAVDMNQVAMMTTVCPDRVVQTALVGGSSKELSLGPGNGFSILENETIPEGTATTQASINNPYVPVPDPE